MDNRYAPIPAPNLPNLELAVIWRKRDNQMMLLLNLRSRGDSSHVINFPNAKCAKENNLDIYYTTVFQDVFLDPALYNDPQGYYIAFDRCCRAVDLNNITDSRNTSLTEILEFPPVTTINSSPVFTTKSTGEYLCKGKPFKSNFGATDADGDELKYSLVNPFSGYTSLTFLNGSGPYFDLIPRPNRRTVNWASGYNKNNQIPGNPPLTINANTGEISVTPTEAGFYGFSIVCEEYRNGVKIGSTQLDFSIKVLDCSNEALPKPVVSYNTKPLTALDLCVGTSGVLSTDQNPEWHYQWQKNGVNLPNDTTNSLKVTEKGLYKVITSSNKKCTSEANSDTVSVAVVPNVTPPKIKAEKNDACEGEIIELGLQNSTLDVNWYRDGIFIAKDEKFDATVSGDYMAKLTAETTCPQTPESVKLTFYPSPTLSMPSETEYQICAGDTIVLKTDERPTFSYQWFKENVAINNAIEHTLKVGAIGNYTVRVKENICETKSGIYAVTFKAICIGDGSTRLYMSDAFSPNGDNTNESWGIFNIEKFPEAEVFIYTRWGEIVFYSKGYTTPWDGTSGGRKVQTGNYFFVIKPNAANLENITGSVMVLY